MSVCLSETSISRSCPLARESTGAKRQKVWSRSTYSSSSSAVQIFVLTHPSFPLLYLSPSVFRDPPAPLVLLKKQDVKKCLWISEINHPTIFKCETCHSSLRYKLDILFGEIADCIFLSLCESEIILFSEKKFRTQAYIISRYWTL